MKTHKNYHSSLIESLQNPLEAAAYLDAVFEDSDFEHISLALKNVAEAHRNADDDWETCYQLLSQDKMPELPAIMSLLYGLGLKLSVTINEKPAA